MKLELSQKLQQQQILAPQMILSMDILLLPVQDLEQRIQREFEDNPALELRERHGEPAGKSRAEGTAGEGDSRPPSSGFENLGAFNSQPGRLYDSSPRRSRSGDADPKYEAIQNTAGRPPGLKDHLTQQLHLRDLAADVCSAAESIVQNLDHRGYLLGTPEELRASLDAPQRETFTKALATVRSLDPPGVGAENLPQCLLLQLARDRQDYFLEEEIIQKHLEDLSLNRIPKIAKDLGATIDEVKQAVEIIASLDPHPGGRLESEPTIYIRPDVVVEEVDGQLEVRVNNQTLPPLYVSQSCKDLLKSSRGNRGITDFLRRKIETAQWLIQAVQQRQRTLQDIAAALVEHQREFMLHGPELLKVLKMQTLADVVGVHISTISRAIKGKYIQTPHGTFEMRYFFTGGVSTATGEIESRRNVCRILKEIVATEDKSSPYSDTELAQILKNRGIRIARRTVTKYREQASIPSTRLRKSY